MPTYSTGTSVQCDILMQLDVAELGRGSLDRLEMFNRGWS